MGVLEKRVDAYLKAVKEHRRDLKRLSAQLITIQEKNCQRISQEIHDEIGQSITAIGINLALIGEALPLELVPIIRERLTETRSLTDQILEQIHELCLVLSAPMLHDLGLVPTLRQYVNRYRKRLNIKTKLELINLK